MKIRELPPRYRRLAHKRREEAPGGSNTDILNWAFLWEKTPEGYDFWRDCYHAETVDELPPLPNESPDKITVKVNEPKLSELVQEWAFENGFKGIDSSTVVKCRSKPYLYIDRDTEIITYIMLDNPSNCKEYNTYTDLKEIKKWLEENDKTEPDLPDYIKEIAERSVVFSSAKLCVTKEEWLKVADYLREES